MSSDPDRIAVPTNGRGPHPVIDTPPGRADAAVTPADDTGPGTGSPVPFTPAQLAIGAGVVASLILLILGRARRRDPDD